MTEEWSSGEDDGNDDSGGGDDDDGGGGSVGDRTLTITCFWRFHKVGDIQYT